MAERVTYLEDPYKSENDKDTYKSLDLSNGLRALLVSVPTPHIGAHPHNASCSLLVDHGPFADPCNYQGLAHMLQHMIFMGSTPDAGQNVFFEHVKKHGGECWSSIHSEDTQFTFEVSDQHLESSLDFLAFALKNPLMPQETMECGRAIVESEFQRLAKKGDNRRSQLLDSLASAGYPHGSFHLGNMKSLKDNVSDDKDLHAALHAAWCDNYAANRMYVCLKARLPIDVLECMVIRHFGQLRCNDIMAPDLSKFDYRHAYRSEFHEQVFYVEDVDNCCKLELTWVLPSMRSYYHSNPDKLLSRQISYKGEGSLFAYLQRRHWACHLGAGIDEAYFNNHSMHGLFKVYIFLSSEGYKHIDEVLFATFAYLKIFANSSKESMLKLYEDQQKGQAAEFRLPDRLYSHDVDELVFRSKYYPAKYILTARQLTYDKSMRHLSKLIGILNSFKFNLMITSQDKVYDKQEQWFGTRYTSKPMPENWKELWKKSQTQRIAELFLPEPNPFVAHDFTIFWHEQGRPKLPPYPKRLIKTNTCELWFRQDDKFGKPQAYLCFFFLTPLPRESAKNAAMCDMYASMVEMHVQNELDLAEEANLNCRFLVMDNGLRLFVSGYNEKLHLIVEAIAEGMINFCDTIAERLFSRDRQVQGKTYLERLKCPCTFSKNILQYVLGEKPWTTEDLYKALNAITLEELKTFAHKLPQQLYIKALIQGNYTEQAAHKVLNALLSRLECKPIGDQRLAKNRIVKLPRGSKVFCFDMKGTRTNVTNYYQFGENSLRAEVIFNLISMMVNSQHYHTEELKAGGVKGWTHVNAGILGYYLSVNFEGNAAAEESANTINKDMDTLRRQSWMLVHQLDDQSYAAMKEQLLLVALGPPPTLLNEVGENFNEIVQGTYVFGRTQRKAHVMRSLTKADVKRFLSDTNGRSLRKLSVELIGHNATNVGERDEKLDDAIHDFKSGLEMYQKVTVLPCVDGNWLQIPNQVGDVCN
ncbi:blast:Nardilysin [Drosophila guanche]|uniref:Blast:Nardilysin n=2 Tax=Drosophila guanche TaxID=7266 RepID=A0A3B0JJ55_DROGU|nr:blast:Nardilysin [Drosophila guanche]